MGKATIFPHPIDGPSPARFTSFGGNATLHTIDVHATPPDKCTISDDPRFNVDSHLCIYLQNFRQDVRCEGDEGGALVLRYDDNATNFWAIGTMGSIYGLPCDSYSGWRYARLNRLEYYADWIESQACGEKQVSGSTHVGVTTVSFIHVILLGSISTNGLLHLG